jgi:hypothetical protein
MATLYVIRDWDKNFEVAQSKRAENLRWVPLPNKHDGKSFRRLIQMKNGPAIYGAWVLIVQVASKCPTRGVLADGDGPLTSDDIADKTLTDPKLIQSALDACCSKAIGWIEKRESRSECDQPQSIVINRDAPTGQDSTGHNRQDSTGQYTAAPDVVAAWNRIPGVVHVRELTVARKRSLEVRLSEPEWSESWQAGLAKIAASEFCRGTSDSGWKASFDWFIKPDTLTKILEGKYDNRTGRPGTSGGGAANMFQREQAREDQQLGTIDAWLAKRSGVQPAGLREVDGVSDGDEAHGFLDGPAT